MSNQRKPNVALKCCPLSAMYSPVMNRLATSKLRPVFGAGTGAGDVGDTSEAVEIGDRARLASAREKHVEHLGARAERLDTARDMPRLSGLPRRQRRARAEHLRTEEPSGAHPRPGGQKLAAARRMPVARLKRANGDG
jgi:hypothetical protein